MSKETAALKNLVIVLYIASGIFLAIGIYMYAFHIETSRGSISNGRGTSPNTLTGNSVIVLGLITAIFASILNYYRKKENI